MRALCRPEVQESLGTVVDLVPLGHECEGHWIGPPLYEFEGYGEVPETGRYGVLAVIQVHRAPLLSPWKLGVESGGGVQREGRGLQAVALLSEDFLVVRPLDVLLVQVHVLEDTQGEGAGRGLGIEGQVVEGAATVEGDGLQLRLEQVHELEGQQHFVQQGVP